MLSYCRLVLRYLLSFYLLYILNLYALELEQF